jgi:LacI family transcriptional regulator
LVEKNITLKDIAKLVNLSPSTVSLAINNKPGLSKDTRERIRRVAQALNFTPNIAARSLVTQRSNSVSLLITTMKDSVFSSIADGANKVLREKGYLLSIMATEADENLEAREIRAIRARGFDGVITCSSLLDNDNSKKLADLGIPVIWVLRRCFNPFEVDCVGVNNRKGAYIAVEHLIRLGHKKIGMINGPRNTATGAERLEGALKAFNDYRLILPDELIRAGNFLRKSGYEAANLFLKMKVRAQPTAIFAANDDMAIGALNALVDNGLRVPKDIALVGFGDIAAASIRLLNITTIAQHPYEMGRIAAKRLVECIEKKGNYKKPFRMILEPELIIRESCGFKRVKNYLIKKAKDRRV